MSLSVPMINWGYEKFQTLEEITPLYNDWKIDLEKLWIQGKLIESSIEDVREAIEKQIFWIKL
jgi:hypothetical protein